LHDADDGSNNESPSDLKN